MFIFDERLEEGILIWVLFAPKACTSFHATHEVLLETNTLTYRSVVELRANDGPLAVTEVPPEEVPAVVPVVVCPLMQFERAERTWATALIRFWMLVRIPGEVVPEERTPARP